MSPTLCNGKMGHTIVYDEMDDVKQGKGREGAGSGKSVVSLSHS